MTFISWKEDAMSISGFFFFFLVSQQPLLHRKNRKREREGKRGVLFSIKGLHVLLAIRQKRRHYFGDRQNQGTEGD